MKTRFLIPIICIGLFIAVSFMVTVYFYPESFGKEKLIPRGFTYDGTLSDKTMMIVEQCKNQEQNPFADYGFDRYSNGHYYIDNVICELINVEKGGCIEPVYNEDSDVIGCGNYVSYDFPYGETRMEFNEEFCNQNNKAYPIFQEEKDSLYSQYQYICNERGLATIPVNPHAASWAWETPDVCTDDMIRHLLKHSSLFDNNSPYGIESVEYPDEINLDDFDQCVAEILEIRKERLK